MRGKAGLNVTIIADQMWWFCPKLIVAKEWIYFKVTNYYGSHMHEYCLNMDSHILCEHETISQLSAQASTLISVQIPLSLQNNSDTSKSSSSGRSKTTRRAATHEFACSWHTVAITTFRQLTVWFVHRHVLFVFVHWLFQCEWTVFMWVDHGSAPRVGFSVLQRDLGWWRFASACRMEIEKSLDSDEIVYV